MDIFPLNAEQAEADTLRLMKEGFVVVSVGGAEQEAVWNFLFESVADAEIFEKSMSEIAVLYPDCRIADEVMEAIALRYRTVRYTFESAADARRWSKDGLTGF